MKILKSYKYRIYPNKEQEVLIQKTFGCCRFVYNQTLAYRIELYQTQGKSMSKFDCSEYVNKVLRTIQRDDKLAKDVAQKITTKIKEYSNTNKKEVVGVNLNQE